MALNADEARVKLGAGSRTGQLFLLDNAPVTNILYDKQHKVYRIITGSRPEPAPAASS